MLSLGDAVAVNIQFEDAESGDKLSLITFKKSLQGCSLASTKAKDAELQKRGADLPSAYRDLGAVMLLSGGQMVDEYHFVLEVLSLAICTG